MDSGKEVLLVDQSRIGKFIASQRKVQGLTQAALAEQLGITDRAVSKWENGKCLPDASIMLELCGLLEINVNELLSGERLNMDNYKKMAEENLLRLREQEEAANRKLLSLEWVIGISGTLAFFMGMFAGVYAVTSTPWRVVLIGGGTAIFMVSAWYALYIEQSAGYYRCPNCGNRYVPTMAAVFFAPHIGRSRWMKCPKCGKRGLHKKVLTR